MPKLQPSISDTETKVVILFGMAENERPCAARFTNADNHLLIQAANKANFEYFAVTTPELRTIAHGLPAGRVLGGGKLVVPPIKKEVYAELLDLLGDDDLPPNSALLTAEGPSSYPSPKNWAEITKGHLVIAQTSIVFGWWEAVVVERNEDILTLRWRDYPKYAPFQQYVSAVALTPMTDKTAHSHQKG